MTATALRFLVTPTLLAVGLALSAPLAASGRDDVPEDLLHEANPVTSLSEKRVAYFQKQFRAKCGRCHGAEGDGGGAEAQKQDVPPADLTDAGYMSTRTDGQLFYQILVGGLPSCAMPAFGPESDHGWTEKKIWEMVAFVRLFAEQPPK